MRTLTRTMCVTYLAMFVIAVLAPRTVRGDGFRNPPESASALGRLGGKIVQIDDASAATINPANLTQLGATSVVASVSVGYSRREFDSPLGFSEESEDPWSYLPAAFASWPLTDDSQWTMGFGVTVPFGRFTDWGDDVFFGAASPYYAEQSVINYNPSLACRVAQDVSVAVGLSVYQSHLNFKQALPWSSLTMDATTPSGKAEFDGDGVGYGANAAATWRITDRQAVALTVRSPFDIDYDGSFEASNVPDSLAAMGVTSSSDFETTIKYPTIVAAGYGVKLCDTVRAEIDVEWIEHSRNQSMPLDIGNNNALLSTTSIPQNWDDTITVGLGLDWAFAEAWTARAGFMYLPTPTPSDTTIPVASEEDQEVASVGLGYKQGPHAVDLAYAVGFFDGRSVNDNVVPAVNGEYDFEVQMVAISYGYRF